MRSNRVSRRRVSRRRSHRRVSRRRVSRRRSQRRVSRRRSQRRVSRRRSQRRSMKQSGGMLRKKKTVYDNILDNYATVIDISHKRHSDNHESFVSAKEFETPYDQANDAAMLAKSYRERKQKLDQLKKEIDGIDKLDIDNISKNIQHFINQAGILPIRDVTSGYRNPEYELNGYRLALCVARTKVIGLKGKKGKKGKKAPISFNFRTVRDIFSTITGTGDVNELNEMLLVGDSELIVDTGTELSAFVDDTPITLAAAGGEPNMFAGMLDMQAGTEGGGSGGGAMAQTAPVDVPEGIPTEFIRLQDSFNHTQQTMLLLEGMGQNTSELNKDLILKINKLGFIRQGELRQPAWIGSGDECPYCGQFVAQMENIDKNDYPYRRCPYPRCKRIYSRVNV